MNYCSQCSYPSNHPLNLIFNNDNVCSGCIIHKEKYQINWKKKLDQLKKLVSPYRNKKYYDCVVPISGARDSYFTLYVVRKILKLNPILVNYNTHYNTEIGFRNMNYLKTLHGCSHLNLTIDPKEESKHDSPLELDIKTLDTDPDELDLNSLNIGSGDDSLNLDIMELK